VPEIQHNAGMTEGRSSALIIRRAAAVARPQKRSGQPVVLAALLGAAPGALADARALLRDEMTVTTYTVRRVNQVALAGFTRRVAEQADRVAAASSRAETHSLKVGRVLLVSTVAGAASDAMAVVTRDLSLRGFAENRSLDALESTANYAALAVVGAALVAIPVEIPVAVSSIVIFGVGVAVSRAVRPVRRRVIGRRLAGA